MCVIWTKLVETILFTKQEERRGCAGRTRGHRPGKRRAGWTGRLRPTHARPCTTYSSPRMRTHRTAQLGGLSSRLCGDLSGAEIQKGRTRVRIADPTRCTQHKLTQHRKAATLQEKWNQKEHWLCGCLTALSAASCGFGVPFTVQGSSKAFLQPFSTWHAF